MHGDSPGIHEQASREYVAAFEWYFGRSVTAAFRFEDAVEAGLAVVRDSPKRCAQISDRHRWWLIPPFPFAIVFLETQSGPYVVAFAHSKRRFGYWQKRKPKRRDLSSAQDAP